MRIAMVSEHASPLAVLGGEDAGGQNVHVAALAAALADARPRGRVYTRRDAPALPRRRADAPRVDVVHVPAGPAAADRQGRRCCRYMRRFGRLARRALARRTAGPTSCTPTSG